MADSSSFTLNEELDALGYAISALREDAKRLRRDGLPATAASDDRAADCLEHLQRRLRESADVR